MNQEVCDALKEARELITPMEHWTQRAYARDSEGNKTDPRGPDAARWCGLGALRKVVSPNEDYFHIALAAQSKLWAAGFNAKTNDGSSPRISHVQVLSCYDRAIELACNDD